MVEDPTTRRHQPRNYLELLEQRVAFLERTLKQYHPDLADDHLVEPDLSQLKGNLPSSPIQTPQSVDMHQQHSWLAEDQYDKLDDLASQVGLLSLNAAGAEPHYLGSSSTFAFSRVINSSLRQVVLKKPGNTTSAELKEDFSSNLPAPCLLPENETALRLSNAYFQNIHPHYPFLHEPTFRAWEGTVMNQSAGFDTLISDPAPLFFLNMVSQTTDHQWGTKVVAVIWNILAIGDPQRLSGPC